MQFKSTCNSEIATSSSSSIICFKNLFHPSNSRDKGEIPQKLSLADLWQQNKMAWQTNQQKAGGGKKQQTKHLPDQSMSAIIFQQSLPRCIFCFCQCSRNTFFSDSKTRSMCNNKKYDVSLLQEQIIYDSMQLPADRNRPNDVDTDTLVLP
ncbi:hypothetical protein BaRGS_00015649 [Batillaria attramentaria]|uniref:DUF4050 domain-containing protein n=1 Tax=Batillaria attramentaria TaxID=370345 RepID=A0ABD0L1N1_9CAEN